MDAPFLELRSRRVTSLGDAMHVLELKVPPVALVFLMGALMWIVSWAMPAFGFEVPSSDILAVSVAFAGAIISVLGIVSFRQARTTVNPMKPDSTSSLVVSCVYRLTRNPMYLGFLLVLLGWAIFLSNALAFVFLPVFVVYMNRFQIEPEEKALHSLFGPQFVMYTLRVRRWL
jgi:protein-S-isoprenylcysteine O-methyltransferase Ste14